MSILRSYVLVSLLITSTYSALSVEKSDKSTRIIYGDDNRVETYQASARDQILAASSAGMVKNSSYLDLETHIMLQPRSYGEALGLCSDDRFYTQRAAMSCSGFLVGPDLLVTAGHCVESQSECEGQTWIFDYKIRPETGQADLVIDKKNVYKCVKVIDQKLQAPDLTNPTIIAVRSRDFALIKLERVVENRKPLRYREEGKVSSYDLMTVIGHPSLLPQKVTTNGRILMNSSRDNYFVAELDTFAGNSGSPVFNSRTGIVEGILVRGGQDYIDSEENGVGCKIANQVARATQEAPGESVNRILDIPTLKYRKDYLKAAKDGELLKIRQYLQKGLNPMIYDNKMNSALHYAVEGKQVEIIKYLLRTGLKKNHKNLFGQTPKQLADSLGYINLFKLL